MIIHLRHDEIDKAWWDALVRAGRDPSWYACSRVLDAASPGWEALIEEDTGHVMPLTWRRKLGIHYLHQPFAVQRLGVFGPDPSPQLVSEFLSSVPPRFKLWDIRLNQSGNLPLPDGVKVRSLTNMVIDLDGDISEIRSRYSESHRRGLRKWARESGPVPMDPDPFIRFVLGSAQARDWGMRRKDAEVFTRIVRMAVAHGDGAIMGIHRSGAWIAAGLFIEHGDRTIFLKGLASPQGKKEFAMHRLLDAMFEQSVGRSRIFDLAGGERASLRRFYAGFGARGELYLQARSDRLPQPLRWLKERRDGA